MTAPFTRWEGLNIRLQVGASLAIAPNNPNMWVIPRFLHPTSLE